MTGADGFIGSHVAEALLESNFRVTALAQYNSFSNLGWLPEIEKYDEVDVVAGDIRDAHFLEHSAGEASLFVHLAALIAIPHSYSSPQSYVDTNIVGTLNLMEVARKLKARRFVHTSTSEVYGTARYVPIDENHPLQAQSPYSASKIGADALVRSYVDSFEFPALTIRPFNTYGPRQSQRAVIPALAVQFLERKPSIRVGNLSATRDFTFVKDTARAFLLALTAENVVGEVVNLGTGWEVSIDGIIQILSEVTGHSPRIEVEESRLRPENSEVERLVSDNTRASKILGWQPRYAGESGFREGLDQTLSWLDDRLAAGLVDPDSYVT